LAALGYKGHENSPTTRGVSPASDIAGEVNTPDEQAYTVFGSEPLDELVIPDGTHVTEHDLVTDGDVLVGGQSVIELGVRGGGVVAGERVSVGGDIEADGDCRLDMWCEVDGNVLVGSDAYLGERVHITGQLIVSGDLDIGDDVDIEEGFEANGWIVIRNPMPTVVFLFVYLSHLLRIGDEEAAEEVAEAAFADGSEADPARIPRGSRVSDDAWRVSTPATIGDDCRLHGNIRATELTVGSDSEVFGSLRANGDIRVGRDTVIHGDVTTRDGDVTVASGVHVRGDISCEGGVLSEAATVDGTVRARDGITFEEADGTDDDPVDAAAEGATDAAGEFADASRNGGAAEAPTAGDAGGEAGPIPAIVPLGDGELPADRDPEPAIRPVSEGRFGWESDRQRGRNGRSDDGVAAIIADAEAGDDGSEP